MPDIDFAADAATPAPGAAANELAVAVAQWDSVDKEIAELEAQCKAAIAQRTAFEQDVLPNAMAKAGVSSFVAHTGLKVELKSIVNGGCPALSSIEKAKGDEKVAMAAKRAAVFSWLRKEGHDGVILTEVAVSLPKGQYDKAVALAAALRNRGYENVELGQNVNAQTYAKLLRDLHEQGQSFPAELGVFETTVAKISRPKAKAEKGA